jgi:hypothetical protein
MMAPGRIFIECRGSGAVNSEQMLEKLRILFGLVLLPLKR